MDAPELGTLIWIGSPRAGEFSEAFHFCESHAAQLAVRRDCQDAIDRRSSAVRGIVITHPTRSPIENRSLDQLQLAYPNASLLHLLGSHCEGMRPSDLDSAANRIYWHRWQQVLPDWVEKWGHWRPRDTPRCRSVAVVASNFASAEALIELADSTNATTVWMRTAGTPAARNFDAIWWDDSVAQPTSASQWQRRLASFAGSRKGPRHAWIANAPRHDQLMEATAGGIERIVSKPYRINGLLEMLQTQSSHSLKIRAA